MESRHQVDRGSFTTTFDGYDTLPTPEANRPRRKWNFVDEFQQLLGQDSEPDPLFFVESWTFGMTSAVENFQQRRKKQPGTASHQELAQDFEILDTLSFTHEDELSPEFAPWVDATASREPYGSGRSWDPVAEPVPPMQERDQRLLDRESFNLPEPDFPITLAQARQVLDVTPASTRQQIKASYRRKVSQWHPDRIGRGSESLRQRATSHMAAINEAYRLLSGTSVQELT